MSQYANCAFDSLDYDTTRVPIGLEIVLGCLMQSGIPLGQQMVLEAGCGTGNYLQALLPELGSLVGVDSSAQMLAVAGFDVVLAVADLHGVLQGTSYLDTQGPLRD